jgi:hypothetical protein
MADDMSARERECPECGKPVVLKDAGARVPVHGPRNARCAGSRQWPVLRGRAARQKREG